MWNRWALIVGGLFLLWASGLLFALLIEGDTPGHLSTTDVGTVVGFVLLGIASILRLVSVFGNASRKREKGAKGVVA